MTQRQQNFDEPPKLPHDVEALYDDSDPDAPLPKKIGRYLVYLNRWLWKIRTQLNALNNPPAAGGHVIQDESVNLKQRPFLNFTGPGVVASDNATTGATDVTIDATGSGGGGFLVGVEFSNASGNWTVPTGISSIWVTMIAAGGGGASTTVASHGGGGGGAGESIEGMLIKVTAAATIAYAIPGQAAADTDGTDATFGFLVCKAGKKGVNTSTGGAGGGPNGAVATAAAGALGTAESNTFFGGASGGGGGTSIATAGFTGGPAGGRLGSAGGAVASSQAGGGAAASTRYAAGTVGAAGGANATDSGSTDYGVGGPGAGGHAVGKTGGKGGPGYLLITYVGT